MTTFPIFPEMKRKSSIAHIFDFFIFQIHQIYDETPFVYATALSESIILAVDGTA